MQKSNAEIRSKVVKIDDDQFIDDDDAVLIKNILDEKGVFYLVDFLICRGYMSLQEYVEWELDKDRDYLDRKIVVSEKHLKKICALAKKLSKSPIKFERKVNDKRKPSSRSAQARAYFDTIFFSDSYESFDPSVQLFSASPSVCRAIISTLLAGSDKEAQRTWQNTQSLIPAWYPCRSDLELLVNASEKVCTNGKKPKNVFEHIEAQLLPAANRVFGNNSCKFMKPIWHDAKELCEQDPNWRDKPELKIHNAIYSKYLGDDKVALGIFCEVCWEAPEIAQAAMEDKRFPDEKLNEWWIESQENDDIDIIEFPSFLLLMGYRKYDFEKADFQKAPKNFMFTQEVISGKDVRASVRVSLKEISPGLFRVFLSKRPQ